MRRTAGTIALTALLAPLTLAATVVPASAATGSSLTVTTIDRAGKKVGTTLYLWDENTGTPYTFTSGKAHTLPKGTYDVAGSIPDGGGSVNTLAARTLAVSGHTSLTLDARKGKAVKATVSTLSNSAYSTEIDARVCAGGAVAEAEASGAPGTVFVVPNTARTSSYGYLAEWAGGSKDYLVSGGSTHGVPSNPGGSFAVSKLASVHLLVRSGDALGNGLSATFQPLTPNGEGVNCQTDLFVEGVGGQAAFSKNVYLSPGRWQGRTDGYLSSGQVVGEMAASGSYSAGHSYGVSFGDAVFGPSGQPPVVWDHQVTFGVDQIDDPQQPGNSAPEKTQFVLTHSGRTVKKETLQDWGGDGSGFAATIPASGWYDLTVAAQRYIPHVTLPSGILSKTVDLSFHFWANRDQQAVLPVFLTRFEPSGLNGANQAKPRGTTPVALRFDRSDLDRQDVSLPADAVKTAQVWTSTDGKTWHAVTVHHSGSKWTLTVTDPASGAIDLRVKTTDAKGDSTTETINRAWTVS